MGKFVKIIYWLGGSILGLVVLLFGLAMFLLTPSRLTPIVKSVAESYLNAKVDFEQVEVSLFDDFPRVSVALSDARVISYALEGGDTLVTFKSFAVSIDALKLMSGKFAVRSIRIVEPSILGRVDSTGAASWDIVRDKSTSSDTTSTELDLNVNSIVIEGRSRVEVVDDRNGAVMRAGWSDLSIFGALTLDVSKFKLSGLKLRDLSASITTRGDSIKGSVEAPSIGLSDMPIDRMYNVNVGISRADLILRGDTILNNVSLGLDGGLSSRIDSISMDDLVVDINGVKTILDGMVVVGDSTIASKLSISSPSMELVKLLALVPGNAARKEIAKIHSNISFSINATVEGSYNFNQGVLPNVELRLTAPTGSLSMDGFEDKLERFELASTLTIKDGVMRAELENLSMLGAGIALTARGVADDLLGDVYVDGSVKSKIDLSVIMLRLGDLTRQLTASGVVDFEGSGKFKISQLHLATLANTTIEGKLSLSRVKFLMPTLGLSGVVTGNISFGSNANKRDKSMKIGARVVGLRAVFDTLKVEAQDLGSLNGRGIDLWATTSAAPYTKSRVHPFRGHVTAKRLDAMMVDSSRYRLRGLDYDFIVTPDADNDTIPILQSDLKATSASASVGLDRYSIRNMTFVASAKLTPAKKRNNELRNRRLDSLQRLYPDVKRDSLMSHYRKTHPRAVDELAVGDIDMAIGGEFIQLLRRWSANGQIKASRIRVVTPYMPLRTNIRKVDVRFDNNRIDLNSFILDVGRSSMALNGYISNLRSVLAGRGVLEVRLGVKSDTLDFTQIITSINSGVASKDAIARAVDSIGRDAVSEQQMEDIIAQNATQAPLSNLVIIPKNVDAKVTLDVKNAIYGALVMDSLEAELVSKNHILQIKELAATSNVGRMSLGAIYATRSMNDISTSFDIELQGVKVAELIDLIPDIDTLLPMMSSFEGVVDCKFGARAKLDTAMNVIMPSLDAAGSIAGHDMVLLDGQTFTEIAKMLKFKNRKRNYIDSISVQMRIKESKIEIYPFVLTLDRYKTAVSGTQNLDMSFDYHISVLKSIVPFRLGINIFGNLDNWKFRLVKAKYKDENVPSYTQSIDTIRINLRKEIENVFSGTVR